MYVGFDSLAAAARLDRYTGKVAATIELPAPRRRAAHGSLRPHASSCAPAGDSAFIVAVGTDRLVGTVRGAWRPDLPAIAPNGWVAVASGNDVIFVGDDSLRVQRTVAGGAKDLWSFFAWNGFRPRAAELDEPVTFPEDTIVPRDSASRPLAPPTARARPRTARAKPAPPPGAAAPARDSAPRGPQFTVQFAALRIRLRRARGDHARIHVAGADAARRAERARWRDHLSRGHRPLPDARGGGARRAHRRACRYWIYEGAP